MQKRGGMDYISFFAATFIIGGTSFGESNAYRRCNDFLWNLLSSGSIRSPNYPTERNAVACKNYYLFISNSSYSVFEIDDISLYYTNHGSKICSATLLFGKYEVPCENDNPFCVVYTNDRHCLSDGLPRRYSHCSIFHTDSYYVPVILNFRGGYGNESHCSDANPRKDPCDLTHTMTFARGVNMRYQQVYCRKDPTLNLISNSQTTTPKTKPTFSTSESARMREPGQNNFDSVKNDEVDESGRYAIMFSVIGVCAVLLAAIIMIVVRRRSFTNARSRKRMMRNQSSTATMVNSIIYGSRRDVHPSTPTQSSADAETSRPGESEYCYIDVDLGKAEREGNFRFACQYRRHGLSSMANEERNNMLYEEK